MVTPSRAAVRQRSPLGAVVRAGAALALALAAALTAGALQPAQAAAVPPPPTPVGLPTQIEALQPYVAAISCTQSATVGATKLAALLKDTYGVGSGIVRECGSSRSEHFEGRAVDWMVSVRTASGRAAADSFLAWLLATDTRGNQFAMARRLGVMYVIWNDRIWGSYSGTWKPYSSCASTPQTSKDTTCHRDHIHISLGWAGATASTSYWTRSVAPADYGPCRPRDLNWAAPRTAYNGTRCTEHPTVAAPSGSSSATRTLWANSGTVFRSGMTGTVARALQGRLGTPVDGSFGSADVAAMQSLQRASGVPVGTTFDHNTWRAALGLTLPRPATPMPRPRGVTRPAAGAVGGAVHLP